MEIFPIVSIWRFPEKDSIQKDRYNDAKLSVFNVTNFGFKNVLSLGLL